MSQELYAQALERVRFERLMGLEFIPRVAVQRESGVGSRESGTATARPTPDSRLPIPVLSRPVVGASLISKTGTVAERWARLEAQAKACTACALHKARTNVVFGVGDRNARLMFIGEGPGEDEDRTGEPFVGKAGQLLNKIIGAMGVKREEVYIANVVKCRPPGNRTPLPDETASCAPYLFEQIELVAPQVIVTLGAPATKTLLNTIAGISSLRGRWASFRQIPVMPTFHPAFVLRTYTEEIRGQVWSDMKQVMAKLKALPAKV